MLTTLNELYGKIELYVKFEEDNHWDERKDSGYWDKGRHSGSNSLQGDRRPEGPYTHLNTNRAKILNVIKDRSSFKTPLRLITSSKRMDRSRYYEYHRDIGHDKDQCYQLKELIKNK